MFVFGATVCRKRGTDPSPWPGLESIDRRSDSEARSEVEDVILSQQHLHGSLSDHCRVPAGAAALGNARSFRSGAAVIGLCCADLEGAGGFLPTRPILQVSLRNLALFATHGALNMRKWRVGYPAEPRKSAELPPVHPTKKGSSKKLFCFE